MVMVVMVMVMVVKRQTAKTDILLRSDHAPSPPLPIPHCQSCAQSPLQLYDGGHILQAQRHLRALLDQLVHIGEGLRRLSPIGVDGLPKGGLDVLQDVCDLALFPRRKHEDQRRSHANAQLVLQTAELLKRNDAAPNVLPQCGRHDAAPHNNLIFGHGKGDPWQTPPVFGQDVLRIVVVMVMVVMVVMGGGGGGGGNGDGNGGNGGDGGDGDGNGGQAADR